MPGHILVVGSINTDLVVNVPWLPAPGETARGPDVSRIPGGKGANQAVAAARLGASVRMIGATGDDDLGAERVAELEAEGIDVRFVKKVPKCATGMAFIAVNPQGQNSIVVAACANAHVTGGFVRNCEAAFEGAAVILLQLETTLDAVQAAIELGKKHGAHVILNPAPVPTEPIPTMILSSVDDLVPNQTELAKLARQEADTPLIDTVQSLHTKSGTKRIIATLGPDGALISHPPFGQKTLSSYDVNPIDTTAAGDAFIGAYGAALSEGKHCASAVEWGLAAGAFSVTKRGAQPSLPTRQQLEEFLQTARRRPA